MGDTTSIEWTDATWNPIVGCSVVSPGCTNCYAMKMAARLERMLPPDRRGDVVLPNHYAGLTRPSSAGPVWTGRINIAPDRIVTKPLRVRKPTTWFVNSMSDLFHESVPDAWIDRVFAVMALAPQHTFQVLTKRSARMRSYLSGLPERMRQLDCDAGLDLAALPLPNVWLGVSTEDQRRADKRIPDLLATPAAVRFVSAEPLLGPVDLTDLDNTGDCRDQQRHGISALWKTSLRPRLDWIIVGGESGPGARPMHPDWARSLRDQCEAAGVPFFFKQWGEWASLDDDAQPPGAFGEFIGDHWLADQISEQWSTRPMARIGKKAAGRLLDGVEHNGMPLPSAGEVA